MWFWLLLYLLLEWVSYTRYQTRIRKIKAEPKVRRPELLAWRGLRRPLIAEAEYHAELEAQAIPYEAGKSVMTPLYKPLVIYTTLRGVYYGGTLLAKAAGWTRFRAEGLTWWRKGTGPPLLFLHGFGFGVLPYLTALNALTTTHEIFAPEFPGIAFDGQTTLPSVAEYGERLVTFFGLRCFFVLSNSYGSFIHSYLCWKHPGLLRGQLFAEPVCFYPYYATLLKFVELTPRAILQAKDWRQQIMLLASYFLAAKDLNVLHLCQRAQYELYWEGEAALSTIPTTLLLSAEDYILASVALADYFRVQYPMTRVYLLPEYHHGEALFRRRIEIPTRLRSHL